MELITIFLVLALATLVSEDLTCIWAGVLAAEGRISFALAALACLAGIFIGDILLFMAGRVLGRAALARAPLRWFVSEAGVERGSIWFRRRGMAAIALSRFLPGTRLPTYFAAGVLDTSFAKFAVYFLIAAAIWTPLLVGAAMLLGGQVVETALATQQSFLWRAALTVIALFVIFRLALQLISFRGRRLLVGRWRRMTRWEFWPLWCFYPPVVLYVVWLGIKHRSLTLFTCANPGIEEGGFVGESKMAILTGLSRTVESRAFIPATALLEKSVSLHAKLQSARSFMREHELKFPIVLKPDVGERGSGVSVIKNQEELEAYLAKAKDADVILQEHVPGLEFGVFYYRNPNEPTGHILSITTKLFPSVTGDGVNSLENLILQDQRAVCMARAYFETQRERLLDVPARGDSVQLIEIGSHCRGSIFHDGAGLKTVAMEEAIDRLAQGFRGFYFGRFDIRTSSLANFQAGRSFKVLELNGVTSEATSIYDPRNSLFDAYAVLFEQWRLAFEIGAVNRERGVRPAPLNRLAKSVFAKWRKKSERFTAQPRLTSVLKERSA